MAPILRADWSRFAPPRMPIGVRAELTIYKLDNIFLIQAFHLTSLLYIFLRARVSTKKEKYA